MADRKLYNLVNGEFVLNGMPSVHVPTYEEVNGHLEILRNVGFFDDAEMPEPVTFTGESNGRRTTEKQASLYDAMMAEIMGEKDARLRKFMRKHEVRHGNPVRKEKRKAYVKEKCCYSCDPWHGWDTVRKFREIEAEKADARDYEIELRNIAEDAERNAIEAEIRGWELMHAVEQANARAWMAMQDWLEWA